jgi:hypothetical protein
MLKRRLCLDFRKQDEAASLIMGKLSEIARMINLPNFDTVSKRLGGVQTELVNLLSIHALSHVDVVFKDECIRLSMAYYSPPEDEDLDLSLLKLVPVKAEKMVIKLAIPDQSNIQFIAMEKLSSLLPDQVEVRIVDQDGVDYLDKLRSEKFISTLETLESKLQLGGEEIRQRIRQHISTWCLEGSLIGLGIMQELPATKQRLVLLADDQEGLGTEESRIWSKFCAESTQPNWTLIACLKEGFSGLEGWKEIAREDMFDSKTEVMLGHGILEKTDHIMTPEFSPPEERSDKNGNDG